MPTTEFSMNGIPSRARAQAEHLWNSIKDLVQIKPDDEPQMLERIAALLLMYASTQDLAELVRQCPLHERIIENVRKRHESAGWSTSGRYEGSRRQQRTLKA